MKYGISWERAIFERCFFSFTKDIYIVFNQGGERYYFCVEAYLLQNGWVCDGSLGPLRREFDRSYSLEEIEGRADVYPEGETSF